MSWYSQTQKYPREKNTPNTPNLYTTENINLLRNPDLSEKKEHYKTEIFYCI